MSKMVISIMMTGSILLTGCATIMHGTQQNMGISSNPTNANVWLDGYYVGNTPMVVKMARNKDHIVHMELPGYLPQDMIVTKEISAWVVGNLVFGGVVGLVVDALTGGIYVLTPEQLNSHMCRIGHMQMSNDSYYGVVLESDPEWQKVGALTPTVG